MSLPCHVHSFKCSASKPHRFVCACGGVIQGATDAETDMALRYEQERARLEDAHLKLRESNALLEWHRYRYHEQVQASAYQERIIASLQAEVDRLKKTKT